MRFRITPSMSDSKHGLRCAGKPGNIATGSVTAYITKGEIRSQLGDGPVETFKVGQLFFEPSLCSSQWRLCGT